MKLRLRFLVMLLSGVTLLACNAPQIGGDGDVLAANETAIAAQVVQTLQAATEQAVGAAAPTATATLIAAEAAADPTLAPSATPRVPSPTAAGDGEGRGRVEAVLGYPGEAIPKLRVTIRDFNSGRYYFVDTALNQSRVIFDVVELGVYVAFAHVLDQGSPLDFAGGYSQAVLCGLGASCTDHRLIEFEVRPGDTASGIEITDWYASPGTFPAAP